MLNDTQKNVHGRWGWGLAVALWLGAVAAGLGVVARYNNTAGAAAAAPDQWPSSSTMTRDAAGPTLVMMAHPLCTCTRASLAELAEIMARATHRPKAYVMFIKPGQFRKGSNLDDLWRRAASIPGVTIVRDDTGGEAALFGALTSGQVFLYDGAGRLRFSGGTTGSRGHEGDNAGRASILALLDHPEPGQRATQVFGCSLFSPGDSPEHAEATHHDHES